MFACRWAEPGNLDFPVYEIVLGEESVVAWAKAVQQIEADLIVIDTAPTTALLGPPVPYPIWCWCRLPLRLGPRRDIRTLEIVDAVRVRPHGIPRLALVPNRVDRRTLEGQQLVDELTAFGEQVSLPIGDRAALYPRVLNRLPRFQVSRRIGLWRDPLPLRFG